MPSTNIRIPGQCRRLIRCGALVATNSSSPCRWLPASNGGPTVADLAERYLEEHVAVRLKPRTQRRVRGMLHNHILPALGRLPLAAVERSQVVECAWRDQRQRCGALERIWQYLEHRAVRDFRLGPPRPQGPYQSGPRQHRNAELNRSRKRGPTDGICRRGHRRGSGPCPAWACRRRLSERQDLLARRNRRRLGTMSSEAISLSRNDSPIERKRFWADHSPRKKHARLRRRCCLGGRPKPTVALNQRQVRAEILLVNRHALDDSAWQIALPAPF